MRIIIEVLVVAGVAALGVELVFMNDPYTILKPGDQGTVIAVDDVGTVHIAWDRGSSLGAAYGEDRIRRI